MQIVTGFAVISLTVIIYLHQRRNDKENLRGRAWETQQQINYMAIQNIDALKATDIKIRGNINETHTIDDLKRAVYVCFVQINRVNYMWRGWKSGLISKAELLDEAHPTMRLLLGFQEVVDYCLTRGYSKDFVDFMKDQYSVVESDYAQSEDIDDWARNLLKSRIKSN